MRFGGAVTSSACSKISDNLTWVWANAGLSSSAFDELFANLYAFSQADLSVVRGEKVASERQAQLLQKCDVARIAAQVLQQSGSLSFGDCAVVLHIGPVQPLKSLVGLLLEGINLGN